MLIRKITIENFQSYYGSVSLSFSEGLNLIIGNGGKGKSKLFNAFNWVLFGRIYITETGWCETESLGALPRVQMPAYGFVNKKALYETPINGDVKTSVTLEIEDDKNVPYTIERSISFKSIPQDDRMSWEKQSSFLKVMFEDVCGGGMRVCDDFMAEETISNLFPKDIRNYIWFQGESLDRLINFRDKKTLKDAVKHISYYPYYEKLTAIISESCKKIEKRESGAIKKANKNSDMIQDLMSRKERLQYNISKEQEKIKEKEEEIDIMKQELASSDQKMSGLAAYSSLVGNYKDIENKISELNNKITKIDEFQREKLPTRWILRGIGKLVEECGDIIRSYESKTLTAPEKKYLDEPGKAKLEEILNDGKCFVCGSDTHEGTDAHKYILDRLRAQEEFFREMEDFRKNMDFNKQFERLVGKIKDYPDSLIDLLPSIDKQYQESEEKFEKLKSQRQKRRGEKEQLDEQIEQAKRKHGVNPVEEANTANFLGSKIRATRSNLEKKEKELEGVKESLRKNNKELDGIERDLEIVGEKGSATAVSETEWKNISKFLEDICRRVQEEARKELLRKIEIRSNEIYQRFTEHDNGYKGEVKIGEDYSIDFDPGLNTSHEDRKKMSIINALLSLNQEAIGVSYPFISDAPTSSFDIETTHKYLLGIKDIFKQSIIMTKDVDTEGELYRELASQNKVSSVYLLESKVYGDTQNLDLHEVSTVVKTIK